MSEKKDKKNGKNKEAQKSIKSIVGKKQVKKKPQKGKVSMGSSTEKKQIQMKPPQEAAKAKKTPVIKKGSSKELKPLNEKQKKLEKELKKISKDLSEDLNVHLFGGKSPDIVHMESKHDETSSFFKKMVFQCNKCENKFTRDTYIEPLKVIFDCPNCDEKHELLFKPVSKIFMVHSNTSSIVGNSQERK